MKKLKCLSCGGELSLDENKEYGTCQYCHTKYKLNEDLNVNIKFDDNVTGLMNSMFDRVRHPFKHLFVAPFFVIIIAIIIMVIIFATFSTRHSIDSNHQDVNSAKFNLPFTHLNGTQSKFFVENVLDEIVQSNKTNQKTITLIYNDEEITAEKDIINIKHELDKETYEVIYDYSSDGYIKTITIEPLE